MSYFRREQLDELTKLLKSPSPGVRAEELVEATLACCDELLSLGDLDSALGLVRDSAHLMGQVDGELGARLGIGHLRTLYMGYEDGECLLAARTLVSRFADLGFSDASRLARIYEGMSLWRLNRPAESIEVLSRIRMQLLAAPESLHHAMCAVALASAHNTDGHWSMGKQLAMEGVTSAFRLGDRYWESIAWGTLSWAERGLARFSAAEDAARQSLACLEGTRNPYQLNHTHRVLAIILWKRGKLDHALGLAEDCFESAKSRENLGQLKYARLLTAVIHTHAGNFDAAQKELSAPIWIGGPTPESRPSLLRHEYLGDLHLERAQASEALRYYEETWPRAMALVPRGDIVAELRRRIAECHLLLDRPKEAVQGALEAIEHCRDIGDRYEEAATYRVLGSAHAALGQLEDAKRAFDQGFAMYDDIETPYEWGKLWLSYGEWIAKDQAGVFCDRVQALDAHHAAIDHFEAIGAAYRLSEARAGLEALESGMRANGELKFAAENRSRPTRRPRVSAEIARRSQWALETFGVVTRSTGVLAMLEDIARVAASNLPVLVLGESGTGKELIAQGVHRLSGRTGDFVALNCSAVPAAMLEAEIFGHLRGSFTHAVADKPGLFEVAHRGTIFLDEVGEMSLELQAKLLRFLESGSLRRVGATQDTVVDTRVVAATNRPREAIQKGDGFRTDLYYRLAHAVYVLPPLRQRGDDVEMLVDHFLAQSNRECGRQVSLSTAARDRLLEYPWPGNVRQLRALIKKVVVTANHNEVLTPRHLPLDDLAEAPATFDDEMDAQERSRIEKALRDTNGVTAAAAKLLRLKRTTLVGRMRRLGIRR